MIARGWRALRTGLVFVAFGLCCLGLALVVAPWLRLRIADPERRQLAFQVGIWRVHRFLLGLMRGIGVGRFPIEGAERLEEPGLLVVANHPTLIDVIAIGAHLPTADSITKQANVSDPFMGGEIRAAGYISNVGGQGVVDECVARLRRGRTVLVFPEGTRSPEGGLGELQRGAAHIALTAGCDLVPVRLVCDPPTLMRGQKWYEVPDRPFELSLRVGEPIPVRPHLEAVERGDKRGRVARRLTAELREFFEKGLRGPTA